MPIVDYPFRIPSHYYSTPKPAVPVKIINPANGFEICTWALIDTGADVSAIPEFTAKSLGHNVYVVRKQVNFGVGGPVEVYHHTCQINILMSSAEGIVDSDTIAARISQRRFAVIPGLHTMVLGEADFLRRYVLTIDYPNRKFSIRHLKSRFPKKV